MRKFERIWFRVSEEEKSKIEKKAADLGMNVSQLSRMAILNFCESHGSELKPIEGLNGRGVVYLSDDQKHDLLNKLGREQFDHYVSRLAQFIIEKNAKLKNHYRYILEWYEADKPLRMGKAKIEKAKGSKNRRYGNFDPMEAHYNALRRADEVFFEKYYKEEYEAYMQSEERKEYEREMEERRKQPWKEFIN